MIILDVGLRDSSFGSDDAFEFSGFYIKASQPYRQYLVISLYPQLLVVVYIRVPLISSFIQSLVFLSSSFMLPYTQPLWRPWLLYYQYARKSLGFINNVHESQLVQLVQFNVHGKPTRLQASSVQPLKQERGGRVRCKALKGGDGRSSAIKRTYSLWLRPQDNQL